MRPFILLFGLLAMIACNSGDNNKTADKQIENVAQEQEQVKQEATILPGKHPAEDSIAFYLSEILYMRKENKYDELANENQELMTYLKRLCADTTTLQYGFDSLYFNDGMMVLTSEDRKFRIYCWDTETGGTMHFYNAIAQYRTGTGSKAYVLNDISESSEEGGGNCGVWYSQLHTVYANGSRTYYLPVYHGRYSGIESSNGIGAYEIKSGAINEPLIFKPTGKPLHDIFYDFTAGTEEKESTHNSISLSDDKMILSIPVTDKDRIVTDRSLIYKFDGDKFVYDKNAH